MANREANRALTQAGTRGSSGSNTSLLLYTVVAIAIAAIVVVGALLLTNKPTASQTLGSPNAPVGSAVTLASVPTSGRTLGNADAKHTLSMYEDFQCPNCRIFTEDDESKIVTNYVQTGKVKIVYYDLLVIDANVGGTESLDAANAARCAADQGKFWTYHDWLFTNQYGEGSGAFTKDRLKTIGQMVAIQDLTKFNTCVDGGTYNADVRTESSSSGYNSTPTLKIDGGSPLGAYDYATVSAALDQALGASPAPSVGASAAPSATVVPSVAASASPS
ncbi:MAG TPA: thioredoxin domain-containing protein [Candidatus Limnocylindrales bacterium]